MTTRTRNTRTTPTTGNAAPHTYPAKHPYASISDGTYQPKGSNPKHWKAAKPIAETILSDDHTQRPTQDHRTATSRRSALCQYLTWLAANEPELLTNNPLDTDEIRRYLATDGMQRRSSHRSRVALKSILTSFQNNTPTTKTTKTSHRENFINPATDVAVEHALEEASHYRNPITRANSRALILLTRAAGCDGADLRWIRGTDITQKPGAGTWVTIRNPKNTREVPILARYADQLEDLATARGNNPMLSENGTTPTDPSTPGHLTSMLTRALKRAGHNHSINVESLRKAWIAEHIAANTPLLTLMNAAGIRSLRTIETLIKDHAPTMSDNPTHIAYELGGITPKTDRG